MASLPIKVVVEGSPLSLKREALGLDLSGPEPLLSFGEVFVHGGKTFRVIKVCVCVPCTTTLGLGAAQSALKAPSLSSWSPEPNRGSVTEEAGLGGDSALCCLTCNRGGQ